MNSLPMTREDAVNLLKSMPQTDSDMNHYLETESIMRILAEKFNEDAEYWGMVGLLHDVDWSSTRDNPKEHCIKAADILKTRGFDNVFIENVQSHGYGYDGIPAFKNRKRNSKIQYALVAAETVTGVIYAYALMRGKNISDMEVKGLKKKFIDKSFAANCSRELVREIETTGLSLDEFFALSIMAVKKIKDQIGLK
ncbi:MAG: HDIG domain-containing protein [Candidatus Aenigmarchaeota archaeon]|nr:HDIG domain-containing protein [Candidatus Aenigmarchaeota archaeon]